MLDGCNRPILAPTAFDINTSLQRCLVKAIALHGLGLYIYAGEDLPQPSGEAANDAAKPGATVATFSRGQQAQVYKLAMEAGVSLDRVCRYFGVDSLAQIAVVDLPRVIRSLENRRAAASVGWKNVLPNALCLSPVRQTALLESAVPADPV